MGCRQFPACFLNPKQIVQTHCNLLYLHSPRSPFYPCHMQESAPFISRPQKCGEIPNFRSRLGGRICFHEASNCMRLLRMSEYSQVTTRPSGWLCREVGIHFAQSFFGISGEFVIISAVDSWDKTRVFSSSEDEDAVDFSSLLFDCFGCWCQKGEMCMWFLVDYERLSLCKASQSAT